MKSAKTNLYSDARTILEQARGAAVKAVNFSMVIAYWQIGKRIIEEEQHGKRRAGYGEFLIKNLSKRLTKDFGKGFTITNLKYIKAFYLAFPIGHAVRDLSSVKPSTAIVNASRAEFLTNADATPILRNELSWTHYRLLMRVENPKARTCYTEKELITELKAELEQLKNKKLK